MRDWIPKRGLTSWQSLDKFNTKGDSERMIDSTAAALEAVNDAWTRICHECRSVLGSELHYQAMIYHSLRCDGRVPVDQLGMNVKQWIPNVTSDLFKKLDQSKNESFRGGFEPIPDIVIFSPSVGGDWRRRRADHTMKHMLVAIEVKASERANRRLTYSEIAGDIAKLSAHQEEARVRGYNFTPIMLVIDTAPDPKERITQTTSNDLRALCIELGVGWRYLDPCDDEVQRIASEHRLTSGDEQDK